MGCQESYSFPFPNANTVEELIILLNEENMKIKEELKLQAVLIDNNTEEFKNSKFSANKKRFMIDFLSISEYLLEYLKNRKVRHLKNLGILLNDCYCGVYDLENKDFEDDLCKENNSNNTNSNHAYTKTVKDLNNQNSNSSQDENTSSQQENFYSNFSSVKFKECLNKFRLVVSYVRKNTIFRRTPGFISNINI